MKNIFRQNKKNLLLVILITAGTITIGIAYATSGAGPYSWVNIVNGGSLFWGSNSTSIADTNSTGNGTGNYLNLRGYSGIVLRDQGTSAFGTGTEIARIIPSGLVMANGTSYSWSDLGTSLSRKNVGGGADLIIRGFSDVLLETGGTTSYGTGVEDMRVTSAGNVGIGTKTPAQKLEVNGTIQDDGNLTTSSINKEFKITAPNNIPICIGTGC